MEFVDYYEIMGVKPEADAAEIKSAYRKLARKYHPDVSKEKESEDKFKQIGEAYSVLKDKEKRKEYDELRTYAGNRRDDFHVPPGWQGHHAGHGASGFREGGFSAGDSQDFSDFFREIFGGGGAHSSGAGFSTPNRDLE